MEQVVYLVLGVAAAAAIYQILKFIASFLKCLAVLALIVLSVALVLSAVDPAVRSRVHGLTDEAYQVASEKLQIAYDRASVWVSDWLADSLESERRGSERAQLVIEGANAQPLVAKLCDGDGTVARSIVIAQPLSGRTSWLA